MAYIPATEEQKKQEQSEGMNVLAEQQIGAQQQPVQAPESPSQPSTASTVGSGQTATQQPQKAKSKGSGLFTNVRKYIKANQGAGQRIGQEVGKSTQEKAGQIQTAVQKQQSDLNRRLQENQAKLGAAQQFGQQTLQQAGSGGMTDEDVQKFQQLSSGQKRFDAVAAPSFAKQQMEAQRLQQQAKGAETEKGAYDMLRGTFGDKQRYSRGQQQLDSLIFGTDPNARRQAIDNIRQASTQTQTGLQQAKQAAMEGTAGLKFAQQDLQEGLKSGLDTAFGGVRSGLEDRAQQYNVGLEDLSRRIREGLGEKAIYQEDIAQLGDEGRQYLQGLAGKYTGYGKGDSADLLNNIQAAGLLGQEVDGSMTYSDANLQRLAQEQDVSRQRALERLAGISDGNRTFLTDPTSEYGSLQVGKYTGSDIGLFDKAGAGGLREAFGARQDLLGKELESSAQSLEDLYYNQRGYRTGYGTAEGQVGRDALGLAREAIDQGTDISLDDSRLLDLYKSGSDFSGFTLNSLDPAQLEGLVQRDSPGEGSGTSALLSNPQVMRAIEEAQAFKDQTAARRAAIEKLRSGTFNIKSRSPQTANPTAK